MADVISWVMSHGLEMVGALVMICNALIVIFLPIKGDQPEKFLQGVVDFLSKFSAK